VNDDSVPRAALRYAERGWHVLPCHHVTPTGCSCRRTDCASPGKHPRTRIGLHEASTDPHQVQSWWDRWPAANIAIRTGQDSNLVVLDVDPDHGGIDTLRTLVADHGALPTGLRARTGSGGWHLYFTHPGGHVPNSVGRLGAGLDIRADSGYVIAPPSNHRSGRTYVFNDEQAPIPHMPAWLLQSARPKPVPRRDHEPIRIGDAVDAWVRAAIEREANDVRNAPEGCRNTTLNRAAFNLGQLAAAGLADPDTIRRALTTSALTAGLTEHEIAVTIRSGMAAGGRSPRLAPGAGALPQISPLHAQGM